MHHWRCLSVLCCQHACLANALHALFQVCLKVAVDEEAHSSMVITQQVWLICHVTPCQELRMTCSWMSTLSIVEYLSENG